VTLSVKYCPIDTVLKSLSKQSGIDVEEQGELSSEKLTLFVKGVPCNVVLAQISSVIGAQWKNLSGMRVIERNDQERDALSSYLKAEDLVLRKPAEEELEGALARVRAQDETQTEANTSGGGSPLPTFRGRVSASRNRAEMEDRIGLVLENASQSDLDEFWQGTYASDVIGAPTKQDSPLHRPRRDSFSSGGTSIVFGIYDYYGGHTLVVGSSTFPGVVKDYNVPALLRPEGSLASTALGKDALAWPSFDLDDSEGAFNAPMKDEQKPRFGFGVEPAGAKAVVLETQSDLLERFFKETGIPVVADGFRTSLPLDTKPPSGTTPLDWLKSLSGSTGCFVQIKDGVATVRQGGYWRLPEYEIPESSLATMAGDPARLTLVDYANFFAGLTPAQASIFRSATPPEIGFQTSNLVDSIPALRFIGSLSSSFPVNGRPVPVTELGSDSERLAGEAMAESILFGKLWSRSPSSETGRVILASIAPTNVEGPEGTVSGVLLKLTAPIGETVEYEVPLKL
jgi:hypothetical protein